MSNAPLAEFHRGETEAPVPLSSKLTAAALTAGVYALIAVMTSQQGAYTPPRRPQMSQVVGAMPPVIAPVMAPEQTAPKPSRRSWFLAEPPASAAASSGPSSSNGPTIGFTFRDGPGGTRVAGGCYDATWAKAVSEKVRIRFHHPPEKHHVSGVAFVRFVARRDGKLEQLEIVKSSGDKILDDAAYAMVHDAQPLPRIPRWMQVERVDAVLPIAFGTMAGKFKPAEGNCAPDPVLDRET